MNPRKAVLAAGLSLVAAALLVPATTSADLWWFDHREGRFPLSTHKKVAEPSFFPLTLTDKKNNTIKQCEINVTGTIYNKFGGMGEGSFTNFKGNPETCKTSITGCSASVEPVTSPAWGMTLQEEGKKITISNFSVKIKLKGTCSEMALPGESTASGTVVGTFAPFEGGPAAAVDFKEVQVGTNEVWLDGSLGFGTELTGLAEPEGFQAASSPARIDGDALEPVVFTRSFGSVECEEVSLKGTAKNGDSTISVEPSYSECESSIGPATVRTNGCEYVLNLQAELIKEEDYTYRMPTDVSCPPGEAFEIDVFTSHANHTMGAVACRFEVSGAGNEGLNLVELTNKEIIEEVKPTSWMEAHVELEGIDSERTMGTFLTCGPATHNAGTLEGTFELNGTPHEGEGHNGIMILPN
jgi:hypothetical protein